MRLGRLRVVWREHALLAHLRTTDNTCLAIRRGPATCGLLVVHRRAARCQLTTCNGVSSTPYEWDMDIGSWAFKYWAIISVVIRCSSLSC
jgi:hypothetical protein